MAAARGPSRSGLPQDENYHHFEGNEDQHVNNIPTDSDPVTDEQVTDSNQETEQPSTPTNERDRSQLLLPRHTSYSKFWEFIEIVSSNTDLSYEEDTENITAPILTWDLYQENHGHSSPHPQVINYVINDHINTTTLDSTTNIYGSTVQEQKYATAQAISQPYHGNLGVSTQHSIDNCMVYNSYSTESREQRRNNTPFSYSYN